MTLIEFKQISISLYPLVLSRDVYIFFWWVSVFKNKTKNDYYFETLGSFTYSHYYTHTHAYTRRVRRFFPFFISQKDVFLFFCLSSVLFNWGMFVLKIWERPSEVDFIQQKKTILPCSSPPARPLPFVVFIGNFHLG